MNGRPLDLMLRSGAAAALAVDAYAHATDASYYTAPRGGSITQSTLFLIEAAVASLAAFLLIAGWRVTFARRAIWVFAFLVAASALGGVLLYTYAEPGAIGPIPDMYEPTWSVPEKVLSAYAEGIAVGLSALGFALAAISPTRGGGRTARTGYVARA